ncbi:MAG: arginine deiminase family protein [Nanoarchaeota archaeon]|nr:arginine deiminase family protein [Nanoarchaeota archaeon]
MPFHITDEHSHLESVIVASAHSEKMREQQEKFFTLLRNYGVQLLPANLLSTDVHQPYTRDIGFVCQDTFFYNLNRTLPERVPEFSAIQQHLQGQGKIIEIKEGKIEGGDVLVTPELLYIGISERTDVTAVDEVEKYFPVHKLYFRSGVMHLDTRMTLLPREYALIHSPAFLDYDIHQLQKKFELIEITEEEALGLAANVFVINPQTIVVHTGHQRIQKELQDRGFAVEVADYSELIGLQGSFRCTMLPLKRRISP